MKIPKTRTNKYIIGLIGIILCLAALLIKTYAEQAAKPFIKEQMKLFKISREVLFNNSLVKILHQPQVFSRRYADFTANICGVLSRQAKGARYQLNQGEWHEVLHHPPRVPPPFFTIELPAKDLYPGENQLLLEVFDSGSKVETTTLKFRYDPSPIHLPITIDWADRELDVHDGFWETVKVNDTWRVRPKPGFEDYDRVLIVLGAFPGGRRVKTDLIYRYETGKGNPYGFGVLPLWGGRPDDEDFSPRRGWNFSLGWYYSHYHGIGMEFSYKHGDALPKWIATYFGDYNLRAGTKYLLVSETWPEVDGEGNHLRYRQRMKWWAEGEKEPTEWMDLADSEGCPIPQSEYAIALNAHRSQVEFGPVIVEPLEPVIIQEEP